MAGKHLCPKVNYGPQFDDFYETHNSLMLLAGDFAIFNFSQIVEGNVQSVGRNSFMHLSEIQLSMS
jgi:hypothetical protein